MTRDQRRIFPIVWAVATLLTAGAFGCSSAAAPSSAAPGVDGGGAASTKPLLTLKGGAQ